MQSNRFKVWRSKQPVWLNIIIDIVDTIMSLIGILIVGIGVLIAIAVFLIYLFTWMIQLSF